MDYGLHLVKIDLGQIDRGLGIRQDYDAKCKWAPSHWFLKELLLHLKMNQSIIVFWKGVEIFIFIYQTEIPTSFFGGFFFFFFLLNQNFIKIVAFIIIKIF